MSSAETLAMGVSAAAFALMGVGSLVRPEKVLSQFGVPALSSAGRNEVRAVYGGFGIAMSLMLVLAIQDPAWRPGVCLMLAAALSGMAAGRVISALVDRTIALAPLVYLVAEVVLASALYWAA
jgi:hypothetical protein